MKYYNLFLTVFITFTCICLLIQCFTESKTWYHIVSAVAISSGFLSYADFFYAKSKYYSMSYEIEEKLILDNKNKMDEELCLQNDICNMMTELKEKGVDVTKIKLEFEAEKDGYSKVEEQLKKIHFTTEEKRKKKNKDKYIADALTSLAFLSFLCLITFNKLANAICELQDMVSVAAFLVVLSAQLVNSLSKDAYGKKCKHYQSVMEVHQKLYERLFVFYKKLNACYNNGVKNNAD